MPLEIEAKMALRDPQGLRARLRELGARQGATVLEVNTFYDTPEGALQAADRGLRLRVARDVADGREVATLTHKGPRASGELKNRMETEVEVDDAAAGARLLAELGFEVTLSFEKRRETWLLEDCEVVLDELPCLGRFCEVEGPTEAAVQAVRARLGMADAAPISASYIALLSDYVREHGVRSRHLRLEAAP